MLSASRALEPFWRTAGCVPEMAGFFPNTYSGALAAVASQQVLSDLQYVSYVLGAETPAEASEPVYVDNSTGHWDVTQANGNSLQVIADTVSQTVYFIHAAYVGPKQGSTVAALALPARSYLLSTLGLVPSGSATALVAQEGTAAQAFNWSGWSLVLIGVGLVALGFATAGFGDAVVLAILGSAVVTGIVVTGVAVVVLGALDLAFTPTIIGQTCNPDKTSCTVITTSPFGQTTTTTNCTASGCTSTSTTVGGIGGTLMSVGIGLAVILGAGIAGYAAYKYISSRPQKARAPPPATQPS